MQIVVLNACIAGKDLLCACDYVLGNHFASNLCVVDNDTQYSCISL